MPGAGESSAKLAWRRRDLGHNRMREMSKGSEKGEVLVPNSGTRGVVGSMGAAGVRH